MKKTFSLIAFNCHDRFNTQERDKHYDSYLNRINQIINTKRNPPTGVIRRKITHNFSNVLQSYNRQANNTAMFFKLADINRRTFNKSSKITNHPSNVKLRKNREENIRIQNKRLGTSITKQMERPIKMFIFSPIRRKGCFLINKKRKLPNKLTNSVIDD